MNQPPALPPVVNDDSLRAKRERILAVSRTVHSIPEEEGGRLKRRPDPASAPEPRGERFWRRAALAAGGVAALAGGLATALLLRRR
jgi:hypothetical protein